MVQPKFTSLIPEIVQILIILNNKYDLESLSDILEGVINNYPHEISIFAPRLVESLTNLVIQHLADYNSDKLMLVSGYLRTISGMISSITNIDILIEMFKKSFNLIVFIFKQAKTDFYQETIDMMVNYIYNFKFVDDSMFYIFTIILQIDKNEISNNIDEIANLIDNYIAFGKEKIMRLEYWNLVINFIENMCLVDQENFFDEDHNYGCRIIESILLNNGSLISDKIDAFIGYATYNKSFFEDKSSSWVYSWNVIMHCFVVNPSLTIQIMHIRSLFNEFFEVLYDKIGLFTRVHDKKTILLFMGVLMRQDILNIDYKKIANVMFITLKTLPDAINKRNMEKCEDEKSESDYETDEDSFSDYNDHMLDEDIYFETVLDEFDPFSYVSKSLSEVKIGTIAESLINSLTDSQKISIQKILSTKQPKQN